MTIGAPFPADLPDLLRLACGQGKMRLNVWFGARENGRKHQANLANSGNGWTIDYDEDPLEAITKVLRIRFGAMLERQRSGCTSEELREIDPVHPDFADAVAAAPDIDLEGLIG